MVKLLELFSGTGSVGSVATRMGYEVVSVDRDMPATHQCDIKEWDYRQYPLNILMYCGLLPHAPTTVVL